MLNVAEHHRAEHHRTEKGRPPLKAHNPGPTGPGRRQKGRVFRGVLCGGQDTLSRGGSWAIGTGLSPGLP